MELRPAEGEIISRSLMIRSLRDELIWAYEGTFFDDYIIVGWVVRLFFLFLGFPVQAR